MLALSEPCDFLIVYTAHGSEDGVETWLFILQGDDEKPGAGPRRLASRR
jgi:hypothetical protein